MAESIFSVKPENLFNREEPLDIGMIPIYILTNQEKLNGASVSVQDGVLEKVAELLGTNFYVLPSSMPCVWKGISSYNQPGILFRCLPGLCKTEIRAGTQTPEAAKPTMICPQLSLKSP